jgi:MFS family permease
MLLQGGRGGFFVSSLPFVMNVAQPRERGYAFSAQVALEPLAAFAGSLIAGALPELLSSVLHTTPQQPLPYRLALVLAPLLLIPALAALRGTRERHAGQAAGHVMRPGRAPWLLIAVMAVVVMLRVSALGAVRTFFNVYLDVELQASPALIGALSAGAQLISVPAALLAPVLVDRYGTVPSMTFGSLCIALSILPLALVRHWSAAGLGFAGMTALFALTTGPIRAYSQEIVVPQWRGAMSGAVLMGVGLTYALMALIGGYSIAALGYRGVFLAGAGLTAIGALLFWAVFRVARGELRAGQ